MDGDEATAFPEDLSGHFWTQLEHSPEIGRWKFVIFDYQNNVMLSGLTTTVQQATRIVHAWDAIISSTSEGNEDPSLPFRE